MYMRTVFQEMRIRDDVSSYPYFRLTYPDFSDKVVISEKGRMK